ncbi:MAG: hypothetical protein FJ146_04650 [Deltaproteobacteria bacterium]|nr:hypothetical protein [Deltaproteobacteria bacterium]
MSTPSMFADRPLRLFYWNADPRVLDADLMQLEKLLKRLGDVKLTSIKSLDLIPQDGCDLLIIAAHSIPKKEFPKWLMGLRSRIHGNGKIWVPALILADVGFDILADILTEVTAENWYFDILMPLHVESLPIRVANLLRIHDHLHELDRYELAIVEVSTRVKELESELMKLRNSSQSP